MTTTKTDEIKTWQQRLEETCPALGPMHIHACVEEVNDAMQAEIDDLRAALREQAREGVAVAIKDAVGCVLEGWNLPEPVRKILETAYYAAPQPAQPEQGERTRARSEFWKAALGDNSKLANLAKAAIKEAESPNKSKPAWIGLSTEERDNLVGDLVGYGTETVAPLYSVIEQVERNLKERNASLQYAQPVAQPNIQNQIVKDISRHEPCHTCAHYQQGKLPGVRIHDETCYECRSYWGNKWEAA